jgi:hypothetical protein
MRVRIETSFLFQSDGLTAIVRGSGTIKQVPIRLLFGFAALLLITSLAGCNAADPVVAPAVDPMDDPAMEKTAPVGTVWSEAMESPLLEPYKGRWRLDLKLTGDPRVDQASGPLIAMPAVETDIVIKGQFITELTVPEGQYRLFAAHSHDGWICARAWYHEDRHDDGDMSKCHVQMRLDGPDLHFQVRHAGRGVEFTDPDFASNPPVIGLDQSQCSLANDVDYDWQPWLSYVYTSVK